MGRLKCGQRNKKGKIEMMRGGGEQREREHVMGGRGATQSERGEGKDGRKDYRIVKKATIDPGPKQWIGGCDAMRSRVLEEK